MFEQLESQHYYSRELISNAIMNRLQSLFLIVVSYEFHYCSVLTIVAALGAGEAHACTRSAHAHAVLLHELCVFIS